jgi:hypothetical protein
VQPSGQSDAALLTPKRRVGYNSRSRWKKDFRLHLPVATLGQLQALRGMSIEADDPAAVERLAQAVQASTGESVGLHM